MHLAYVLHRSFLTRTNKPLMPIISDLWRSILMVIVVGISIVNFSEAPDWTATSCELLDRYPSEENMKKWVWCINSTTIYTLKNSDRKTALCCTEDTSSSAIVTTVLSVIIPIILASVELDKALEAMRIADKETNKNKALDAATAE